MNERLSKTNNEQNDEHDQNRKDPHGQSPVRFERHEGIRQDGHTHIDVRIGIVNVVFDALHHFGVFVDHDGEFVENGAQFNNVAFDRRHGVGAFAQVILIGNELRLLLQPNIFFGFRSCSS